MKGFTPLRLGVIVTSMIVLFTFVNPFSMNIDAKLFAQSESVSNQILEIARPRVNLRSGPGTSYTIVGTGTQGQTFTVIGQNSSGTWYEISYSNAASGNAWVYAGIVNVSTVTTSSQASQAVSSPASAAPTATPVRSSVRSSVAPTSVPVAQQAAPASNTATQPTAQSATQSITQSAIGGVLVLRQASGKLYNGPGSNYQVVGTATNAQAYAIVAESGSWVQVRVVGLNVSTAWLASNIVTIYYPTPASSAPAPAYVAPTAVPTSASVAAISAPAAAPVSVAPTAVPPTAVPPTAVPAAPAAPSTSTAGLSGRLLYSVANMDAKRWELWEFNFANSANTKIADWRTEIDVSVDGRQIVYYAWPEKAGEKRGVWIMDSDFTNERLVIQGGAYPSFSPGGDRLVLNGGPDIYVINTDGGGLRGLTRGEYPAWSPVDDRIVHRACVGGGCGLWIIDANSSDPNARSRVTTGGSDGQPSWSPDGSRIAYISQEDGNFEVYVIGADGSGKIRLTNDLASDGLPTWSPDGQWIAFRSDRGGSWAIYVVRPDGSDLRKIVDADVLPLWFFEKMYWRR
ncbi:MAG: SH3 domain-containing protein [Chloroflexota bacterium]